MRDAAPMIVCFIAKCLSLFIAILNDKIWSFLWNSTIKFLDSTLNDTPWLPCAITKTTRSDSDANITPYGDEFPNEKNEFQSFYISYKQVSNCRDIKSFTMPMSWRVYAKWRFFGHIAFYDAGISTFGHLYMDYMQHRDHLPLNTQWDVLTFSCPKYLLVIILFILVSPRMWRLLSRTRILLTIRISLMEIC